MSYKNIVSNHHLSQTSLLLIKLKMDHYSYMPSKYFAFDSETQIVTNEIYKLIILWAFISGLV